MALKRRHYSLLITKHEQKRNGIARELALVGLQSLKYIVIKRVCSVIPNYHSTR